MSEERLERAIRDALLRDEPGPLPERLRTRVGTIANGRDQHRWHFAVGIRLARALLVMLTLVAAVGLAAATLPHNRAAGPAASAMPSAAPASVEPTLTATSPSPLPHTPRPAASVWSRVQFGGMAPGPLIIAGSKLVLVTNPATATGGAHPTLWSSSDGTTWQRLADSAVSGAPGNGSVRILGLGSKDGGLVAVGAHMNADATAAVAEAWTSPDGKTWTQAVVAGAADATMNLVYAGPHDFVAIGTGRYSLRANRTAGIAVWTSPDGARWTRLPESEVPAGVAIASVAAGAGRYVAVGQAIAPGGSPTADESPVWTSADGVHYAMLTKAGSPPPDAGLLDVIWTGSTFVAVGSEQTSGASVWESPDGLTWHSTELPAVGAVQARGSAICRGTAGFFAVGTIADASGNLGGAAWTSPDGQGWTRLPVSGLQNASLSSALCFEGRVLVEGQDMGTGASELWLATP